jgi:hypothetical protein
MDKTIIILRSRTRNKIQLSTVQNPIILTEMKMTRGRAVGVASPVSARGLDLVLPSAAVGGTDVTA